MLQGEALVLWRQQRPLVKSLVGISRSSDLRVQVDNLTEIWMYRGHNKGVVPDFDQKHTICTKHSRCVCWCVGGTSLLVGCVLGKKTVAREQPRSSLKQRPSEEGEDLKFSLPSDDENGSGNLTSRISLKTFLCLIFCSIFWNSQQYFCFDPIPLCLKWRIKAISWFNAPHAATLILCFCERECCYIIRCRL